MSGRLLLCAPSSGSGKTTVTCGLLGALKNSGVPVVAFKAGPDYIDPMFYRQILGTQSYNLDLFLMGEQRVAHCITRHVRDEQVAILEGAMGYYDGIAMSSQYSAHHLAQVTQSPAVLVVDGRGAACSVVPQIKGFLEFSTPSFIKGVILNGISPMLYPRLKAVIEEHLPVTVYGYLPFQKEFALESRHLGLVTAREVPNLEEKMARLAQVARGTLDLVGLLNLAKSAPNLPKAVPAPVVPAKVKIAIARDDAFCFYYADALERLELLGAKLIPFSPLKDGELPHGVQGLYLGGGYPELYAKELSQNATMCQAVAQAVARGMPTVAECGGFLYLHQTLEDNHGDSYPLCGVIQGKGYGTKKLSRFGYVTLTAEEDGLLFRVGEAIPAHEFHYWDSTAVGTQCQAIKPQSTRNWQTAHHSKTLYAGFPHLHMGGEMGQRCAQRFVEACGQYDPPHPQ